MKNHQISEEERQATQELLASTKLRPIEIAILKGLVSGDGDIGGRMASSHPDAVNPVSKDVMKLLEMIAEAHASVKTPFGDIDKMHSI